MAHIRRRKHQLHIRRRMCRLCIRRRKHRLTIRRRTHRLRRRRHRHQLIIRRCKCRLRARRRRHRLRIRRCRHRLTIDTINITNVATNNTAINKNNNNINHNNISLNISDIPNGAATTFGTIANRITDDCWEEPPLAPTPTPPDTLIQCACYSPSVRRTGPCLARPPCGHRSAGPCVRLLTSTRLPPLWSTFDTTA